MNKRQAKRWATKWAAAVLWGHAADGPEGLFRDGREEITDPADCRRVMEALRDLAEELRWRGEEERE